VYVQKYNGIYIARPVENLVTQIPDKDFHKYHSPVVNDTTFRTTLYEFEAGI
jgi:hypothetical protein